MEYFKIENSEYVRCTNYHIGEIIAALVLIGTKFPSFSLKKPQFHAALKIALTFRRRNKLIDKTNEKL